MKKVIVLAIVGFLSAFSQAFSQTSNDDLTTYYNKFLPLGKYCNTIPDAFKAATFEFHKDPPHRSAIFNSNGTGCTDLFMLKKAPEVFMLYRLVYESKVQGVRIRVFKVLSIARFNKAVFVWDIKRVRDYVPSGPVTHEEAMYRKFLSNFY